MKNTNTNPPFKNINNNTHDKKKTIKKIDDLPDWFDINKYEATKNMSPQDWFSQLLVRNILEQVFRDCPHSYFYLTYKDYGTYIEKDPFPNWKQTSEKMREIIDTFHLRAVELARVLSSYGFLRGTLSNKQYQYLSDWYAKFITFEKQPPKVEKMPDWFIQELNSKSNKILIEIDLEAADQLIFKQLKPLMQQEREKRAMNEEQIIINASPKQLQSWYEFGVFPYCDLRNWARVNRISIPYRIYADAIFTRCEKGEETIRRTTKKLTNKLLTADAIYQFYLQLTLDNRHEK